MNRPFVSSKKLMASLTVLATVIMPYVSRVPVAQATQSDVRICHSTGNGGYQSLWVNPNAIDGDGGGDHNSIGHQQGQDIIPPGYWDWTGRNWDAEGQALYNNGCDAPCGPENSVVYEKTSDYDGDRVTIEFEEDESWKSGYKRTISVAGNGGWTVVRVWLDVENDDHSGYHLYATGPISDLNPNPGDRINKVKVEVVKECTPTTGTIIVRKVIGEGVDEDINTSDFFFSVNDEEPVAFEADGENALTEQAPGAYAITEEYSGGFTPTYDNCSFTLEAGETEICTITNTEVPPAHIIVKKRVQDEPREGDEFTVQLTRGEEDEVQTTTIQGPALGDSFFDIFFDAKGETADITLEETNITVPWQFVEVFCWEGDGDRPDASEEEESQDEYQTQTALAPERFVYEGSGVAMTIGPEDAVTCEFTNRRPGGGSHQEFGTLVLEKYIRSEASVGFDEFWYDVDGAQMGASGWFDESGRNTFEHVPVGSYSVWEEQNEGYLEPVFGGDCDENGSVDVTKDESATCTITNTSEGWQEGDGQVGPSPTPTPDAEHVGGNGPTPGTLTVVKVFMLPEDAAPGYTAFGFTVGSVSEQFEEDGSNDVELAPGTYTVLEHAVPGYTHTFSDGCDADGVVTVPEGGAVTCTISNTLGVGGFNPGSDIPAPTQTPTPTPIPTRSAAEGSDGSDDSVPPSTTPEPSAAPASPSAGVGELTAVAGAFFGIDLCSEGGNLFWWITLLGLALLMGILARRRGIRIWMLLAYVLVWGLWAWKLCGFGYWWLPILLALIIWMVPAPKPEQAS